ncbi:hypothetical protein AURDEDRAFT_164677 [Auricularia subglabra TFB-10046 SS5]|nr:hypothetical protein AURDEDRAFT_164677 [Auricularia subglabra TFB-10046 SS5]
MTRSPAVDDDEEHAPDNESILAMPTQDQDVQDLEARPMVAKITAVMQNVIEDAQGSRNNGRRFECGKSNRTEVDDEEQLSKRPISEGPRIISLQVPSGSPALSVPFTS